MIDELELYEAWMIEIHPKGGSRFRQVRDVMREHQERLKRKAACEWVAVAIKPDLESAKKELKKIRKNFRELNNDGGRCRGGAGE